MRIVFTTVFFFLLNILQCQIANYEQFVINDRDVFSSLNNTLDRKTTDFKPDSSINKHLFLKNPESAFTSYKDKNNFQLIEKIRETPIVIFSDQEKKEYLLAYKYEGNPEGVFSCFEIGHFDDDLKIIRHKAISTKEIVFKTESDLGLGNTLAQVIKAKGKNFESRNVGSDTILTYRLSYENSFVKKHHMPGYFMEFRFRYNKVTRITFGFDYP